jgi:hypothetical protein
VIRQSGATSDNNYLHVLGSRHPLGFALIDTPGHRCFFKNAVRGFLQVRTPRNIIGYYDVFLIFYYQIAMHIAE